MEILSTTTQSVCTIEFNRPQAKNALTAAMYLSLAEELARAGDDPDVKVILLRGNEKAFTAGNDLGDFLNNPPTGEASPAFAFVRELSTATKPVVAAVTGLAIGIGTTMLLHCDLVYVGAGARFSLPFVRLGICPEAGSSMLLPASGGYQRAAERLLLGEMFDAAQAYELGFVTAVLSDDEVVAHASAKAVELCSLPIESLLVTKALMKRGAKSLVQDQIQEERENIQRMVLAPPARAAMTALLNKPKKG